MGTHMFMYVMLYLYTKVPKTKLLFIALQRINFKKSFRDTYIQGKSEYTTEDTVCQHIIMDTGQQTWQDPVAPQ